MGIDWGFEDHVITLKHIRTCPNPPPEWGNVAKWERQEVEILRWLAVKYNVNRFLFCQRYGSDYQDIEDLVYG